MEAPTIEGLRQVACEPKTRIALEEPLAAVHDSIFAVRVDGGFCKDQTFWFNESLNCIVGDNHAGKSAVFDFIRFVLGHTNCDADDESRRTLLRRLAAILQPDSKVEVFVRSDGDYYVVERTFQPINTGATVTGCHNSPLAYVYDLASENLEPVSDFSFSIEVYEQGRIGQLRSDIQRQLEMLDEFAELDADKDRRSNIYEKLTTNASELKPHYAEQETLKAGIAEFSRLQSELKEFEKQLPDEGEESQWGNAQGVVDGINGAVDTITQAASQIPNPDEPDELADPEDVLAQLFSQTLPAVPAENVVDREELDAWRSAVQADLNAIESVRKDLVAAVAKLKATNAAHLKPWKQKHDEYEKILSQQLAKSGVESPTELRQQVNSHRTKIRAIKEKKQPRLAVVDAEISRLETERNNLRNELRKANETITKVRKENAEELNKAFDKKIIVEVEQSGDTSQYHEVLREVCDSITSKHQSIRNREQHLSSIVANVSPVELAEALCNKGRIKSRSGSPTLLQVSDITQNTQDVLCTTAADIDLINRIETVDVADVPRIKVRRDGAESYADLATGLSPGEQSAAILTLALQTRSRPLIVDQPEDELGYYYVVNLIVPKILGAKFQRQLLVVTHVANIPVLGDADYVVKMENRPHPDTGRKCVVVAEGCFEKSEITSAVVQLEGGEQAFRFRQHRYSLTKIQPLLALKKTKKARLPAKSEPATVGP